jgi:hypothetical protein
MSKCEFCGTIQNGEHSVACDEYCKKDCASLVICKLWNLINFIGELYETLTPSDLYCTHLIKPNAHRKKKKK